MKYSQRFHFKTCMLLTAGLMMMACGKEPSSELTTQAADLLLTNGGIYTVDANHGWAQAVAVRDGLIIGVGSNEEIQALTGPSTRVIDLDGKMALPGFHDAHVHPLMAGKMLLGCSLMELDSIAAIIDKVTACASGKNSGWIVGDAFDLALFGPDGPGKELLDEIDTPLPIFLTASDGHNAWVNSRALELAQITFETPDPALGVIERDPATGEPSGTLRETAQDLITSLFPAATLEENVTAIHAALQEMNGFGITSFIDAFVGLEDWQAYQDLDRSGQLSARVVTSLTYGPAFSKHHGEEFEQVLASRHEYESGRINNDSIKLFLDGVLEGETAALLEPYLGMGEHRGELIFEPDELDKAVTRFDAMGLQVHMHAIGDGAVRAGLDAFEAARNANGISDNRHHISHLQLINFSDIERFAELDASANFQALWALPDAWIMELNLPVLGEERVQGMYPIGSVLKTGGRIVGGSDWNVSSVNPLDAIEVAVRRQDPLQNDGPVLNENERVDLATMIEAYTINGAWLMHQEQLTGSITVGKRADIIVLDRNLFEIPAQDINEATVLLTLLDGETIFNAQ